MTYAELVNCLIKDGYEVLGEEDGMIFYKKDGDMQGADLRSVYKYYESR